jgi:translation elongation factor EF-Tu-like GTPase
MFKKEDIKRGMKVVVKPGSGSKPHATFKAEVYLEKKKKVVVLNIS